MPSACPPYGGGARLGGGYSNYAPVSNPLEISTHNNFLSLPGTIVSNQKGETLRFIVPQGYSHFECFAFSRVTGVVKKFDLSNESIEKKSLSHNGI